MGDLIGKSVKRVEDNRFLKGDGKYTDDFNMPNQTFAFYVRSPHAHANLVSVDISTAKAMDGVINVLQEKTLKTLEQQGLFVDGMLILRMAIQ